MSKQMFSYETEKDEEGLEDQLFLDREFQWVRTNFFPNWDLTGKWTISLCRYCLGWYGRCNPWQKRILIQKRLLRRRGDKLCCPTLLKVTIIHEIAHAIATWRCNHGRRWLDIIGDCGGRAEDLDMRKLSNLLLLEFFRYVGSRGDRIYAKPVYTKIRELLWERPDSSFEEIMRNIDYMAGMDAVPGYTFVDKKFKLCRRVYDVEKRKISKSKRYFFIETQLVA